MRIKRIITILLGVVALATFAAVLCDWHSRRIVDSEVSEVFRRYAGREDLQVGFIKGYRIGDSITVDVTTITAKDSAGWEALLREFKVGEHTIAAERRARKNGNRIVTTGNRVKNHPELWPQRNSNTEIDLLCFSYLDQTVFIFDVDSKQQARYIAKYKRNEYVVNPINKNNENKN